MSHIYQLLWFSNFCKRPNAYVRVIHRWINHYSNVQCQVILVTLSYKVWTVYNHPPILRVFQNLLHRDLGRIGVVRLRVNSNALYMQRIKTGSEGVCCHDARGHVRNRKSNPSAHRPRDLTYCSHKAERIVTTNTDRSVLITINTSYFQFHLLNISFLHFKYQYSARSESRVASYSHC